LWQVQEQINNQFRDEMINCLAINMAARWEPAEARLNEKPCPIPGLHPQARLTRWALTVITVACLAGCASVHVNKLDPATGAPLKPEGMRFYLPRPYVSVNEPFVIATAVYIATGEMSPDGSFVLLTEIPDALKSDIPVNPSLAKGTQKMGAIAIDANSVLVSTPQAGSAGPQGAPAGEKTTNPAAADASSKTPPAGNATPSSGNASASAPGVLQYKVTNDNQAYGVIPQPRFFNIVWLPDWEEQYVITAKSGFGTANATINMGQGWSLQGLDAKADNSAAVKPLLDFYTATLGALQKAATAKIEGPLAAITGQPQGASAKTPTTAKAAFGGGTLVTLKFTKARIVAPGLYKILKPNELKSLPTLTPDEAKHILAPKYPFTDIPFTTYDVVVIEAARATGDSAFTLGQYTEATSKSLSTTTPSPAPGSNKPPAGTGPLADPQKKLNALLSQPQYMTAAGDYYVSTLSNDAKTGDVLVALKTTNGGKGGKAAALPADSEVIALVVSALNAAGLEVDPKNVTVKH
jgi:hypothetical protein